MKIEIEIDNEEIKTFIDHIEQRQIEYNGRLFSMLELVTPHIRDFLHRKKHSSDE